MNIVVAGSKVQIYGEDVKTYKELPLGSYDVQFNKMTGFYLTPRHDLTVLEEKIYGNHEEKVDKVLRSFKATDRNFGVILNGQKGIGKSLFARILAQKSIAMNYPIITVSMYTPGISDFIASIEQEVVVIFDEFEKTFGASGGDSSYDPQEEMLSLFDGIDNGKKLFVITCNEVNKLNKYLLNRPGRFHYHFTISNPTDEEVAQYMTDKLQTQYHGCIDRIVNFAKTINVTYDYLRAIAFELNQGYSLEETLGDLNITRTSDISFNIRVTFGDREEYVAYSERIDLYSTKACGVRCYGVKNSDSIWFNYIPTDIHIEGGQLTLAPENIQLRLDEDAYWDADEEIMERKKEAYYARMKIKSCKIQKNSFGDINRYAV